MLGLFQSVYAMVEANRVRRDDPRIFAWAISGGYDEKEKDGRVNEFEAWSKAYATRIYPALLADWGESATTWDEFCQERFRAKLARQFLFGDEAKEAKNGALAEYGAHPEIAVISGAMLILSAAAILDLPPFSNFRENVMWIDDHLKYALHKALRHFPSVPTSAGRKLTARVRPASVVKAREVPSDVPWYTTQVYLPRLLWGAIMDAWIQPDAKQKQSTARGLQSKTIGLLTEGLAEAFAYGQLEEKRAKQLHANLVDDAKKRIKLVFDSWKKLTIMESGKKRHTFASAFALGVVPKEVGGKQVTYLGIKLAKAPGFQIHQPIEKKVEDLADDAVGYVRFCLEWARLVRLFRAPEQGSLLSDLGWTPSKE